jgi:hypothetical protein
MSQRLPGSARSPVQVIGPALVRTSPVVLEPFTNPPGYNSLGANVAINRQRTQWSTAPRWRVRCRSRFQ